MTKRFIIKNKGGEQIGIRVESDKDTFTIPIADVRRNRKQVESIEKAANIQRGSKFFRPSYSFMGWSYNISRK